MTDNAGVAGTILEQTHEGEFHGDHGDGSVPVAITSKTKLFAFCAALNSCNLGYDIGVSAEAGMLLKDSMMLSDTQVEIFMGSLNLFAMVGALLSHVIADRSGRRGAFIVSRLYWHLAGFICSASFGIFLVSFCMYHTYYVIRPRIQSTSSYPKPPSHTYPRLRQYPSLSGSLSNRQLKTTRHLWLAGSSWDWALVPA